MTAPATSPTSFDQTALPGVLRRAVQLGVFETVLVAAFAVGSRFLEGGSSRRSARSWCWSGSPP